MKLDDGVRETPPNLSNMGFKVCEAGVEVICGGEDGIGGGDKRVEISEDTGFKVCSWFLPRRMRLLPRKRRLLPRKWTMRSGSMV